MRLIIKEFHLRHKTTWHLIENVSLIKQNVHPEALLH